jgi:hypothetical protein
MQVRLRELGYKPTYDYRIDQLGKIDSVHGAIQVEGTWYCPSMPIDLINATKDLRRPRGHAHTTHPTADGGGLATEMTAGTACSPQDPNKTLGNSSTLGHRWVRKHPLE